MKHEIRDDRGGYIRVDSILLERYGAKIGPIGISVYCALAKFADNRTRDCWPSHQTIADLIGTSARSVRTYLDKLASYHLIQIEERRAEDGRRTSNLYILTPPRMWKEIPPPRQEVPIPLAPGAEELSPNELSPELESRDSSACADTRPNAGSKSLPPQPGQREEVENIQVDELDRPRASPAPKRKRRPSPKVIAQDAVIDAFFAASGVKRPLLDSKADYRAYGAAYRRPAKIILHHCDGDVDLAKRLTAQAVRHLMADGLPVSALRSVQKTVIGLQASNRLTMQSRGSETVTIIDPVTRRKVQVEARL